MLSFCVPLLLNKYGLVEFLVKDSLPIIRQERQPTPQSPEHPINILIILDPLVLLCRSFNDPTLLFSHPFLALHIIPGIDPHISKRLTHV